MDHLSDVSNSPSEDNLRTERLSASTYNYLVEAIRPPSPSAFGWASVDPRTYSTHRFIMSHTLDDSIPSPSEPLSLPSLRRSVSSDSLFSDMSSRDNFNQLPILKQGTFPMWDVALKSLFEAKRLSSLLLADSTVPSGPGATPEDIENYLQKRGRAMSFILGSLDENNKARITINDTPHTAYVKLAKRHDSNKGILTAMVISEITTIRMGAESLSEFLTKIHLLHQKLAIYTSDDDDLKISSKLLAIFLLNSLSSDYATFKTQAFKRIKTLKVEDLLLELELLAASAGDSVTGFELATGTTALATPIKSKHNSGNNRKKSSKQIGPGLDDLCNRPEHANKAYHTNRRCRLRIREGSMLG